MPNSRLLQAAVLIIVSVIFGGGGIGAGIFNLIVQVFSLGLLAFNAEAVLNFFKNSQRAVAFFVAATLLLPILQSIPLPPTIWQSLPGRGLVTESFALLEREDIWFPMSVEARRTFLAFMSLIPPLTIVVLAWDLPETQKRRLLLLVGAAGVFVVILGAQQLATGNRNLVFFTEALASGDLQGTFANRNSAGLFLDISLCALVGALPKRRPSLRWILASAAIAAILITGLFLTRSRSSMALLIVPLGFAVFKFLRSQKINIVSFRTIAAAVFGVVLLSGATAILVRENQRLQQSLSRFDSFEDSRPLIWADTFGSIKRFWPVGSGIGTFDEVFQVDESLENLSPGRAARAHNDYLEVVLESGFMGIVLLAFGGGLLIVGVIQAVHADRSSLAAVAGLACVALQSVSDYPLRNQTLLCVASVMLALLIGGTAQSGKAVFSGKTSR